MTCIRAAGDTAHLIFAEARICSRSPIHLTATALKTYQHRRNRKSGGQRAAIGNRENR